MSKSLKKKVYFATGEQEKIITRILSASNMSISEMAKVLTISSRTLRDWRREKYRMSYEGLALMSERAHYTLPKNLDIRDAYSHTSKAGILGSAAVRKKYGKNFPCDPAYRQSQWEKWWNATGKYNPPLQSQPKPIHKPRHSSDLSEFVGILIGDGGITRYQVTITLNRTDDREYAQYVHKLSSKLFKLEPSLYHNSKDNTISIVISRTELVDFLDTLGLKRGNKIHNGITIPNWILENNLFLKRCLRGIFDTDGGLFLETHKINKKEYSYARLAFVSASKPLIEVLYKSLANLHFHPKVRSGKRVQLEHKDEIVCYFKTIQTSNPKHQKRFERFVVN